MKRKILVELDITGATDAKCGSCRDGWERSLCPWYEGDAFANSDRDEECIAAEKLVRESEGAKGRPVEDLEKAVECLKIEIARLKLLPNSQEPDTIK